MPAPAAYRPTFTPATDAYISVDSFSAPSIDSNGCTWIVTEVIGWTGIPTVRLAQLERPKRAGVFDGPSYSGARVIVINGTTLCPSREAGILAQDIIASVCAWDTVDLFPLVVTEPGRTPRQCNVRVAADTKVTTLYAGYAFDWSLQFTAPDPRRYDTSDTVVVLSLPAANPAGVTFPATFPMTMPLLGSSSNEAILTNNGTAECSPTVVFSGPLTDPQIANITTGLTLSLSYNLLAGDTLVVDFDARSIMLNGTASRTFALQPTAAWWDMEPGANDIVFTGAGGSGQAEVHFRSAWY